MHPHPQLPPHTPSPPLTLTRYLHPTPRLLPSLIIPLCLPPDSPHSACSSSVLTLIITPSQASWVPSLTLTGKPAQLCAKKAPPCITPEVYPQGVEADGHIIFFLYERAHIQTNVCIYVRIHKCLCAHDQACYTHLDKHTYAKRHHIITRMPRDITSLLVCQEASHHHSYAKRHHTITHAYQDYNLMRRMCQG